MTRPHTFQLLLSAIVALLTACGGSPSGSPGSTSTPGFSPTSPATATPPGPAQSPVVGPPANMLPPGSTARVTVDGLRVRAREPGTPEFDQVLATLSRGDELRIQSSPFSYLPPESSPDGRGWYAVTTDDVDYGWVAQGEKGLEYLEHVAHPCLLPDPTIEDLVTVSGLDPAPVHEPWDLLACYGSRSLDLAGMIDFLPGDGAYPFEWVPGWLAYPADTIGLAVPDPSSHTIYPTTLPLRFPDGWYAGAERGDLVEIRGHFDDPAAATCRISPPDFAGSVPDPDFHVLSCRVRFVVDEITVTGHHDLPDPYYP